MARGFSIEYDDGMYYCKDCNKLYKEVYDLDGQVMCRHCFSENIEYLPSKKLKSFIRKKRLENIKNEYNR